MNKQGIAVAISGQGRSLKNLIASQDLYAYQVKAVISSSPHCSGNQIALDHRLPLFVGDFSSPSCAQELETWLEAKQVEWIALAGFLKKFPLLAKLDRRMVNIHPSLLPNYGGPGMYGIRVHNAVHAAGDYESGATVHFVSENYDEGPPIARIRVAVAGLSPESISAKVFEAECKLYPKVLDGLILGDLPLQDGVFELNYP